MATVVRVNASSKEKALILGKERLSKKLNKEITDEELEVRLVEEKRGFLGFGKKKIYEIKLKDVVTEKDEDFLQEAAEEVGVNGTFEIKVVDEGIMLRVKPPEGNGRSVKYQEIKTALDEKEIVEIDWQIVREAIREGSNEWIKIAPRKPELDRDGEVKVEISKDGLKAFLSYIPALGGRKLSLDDFHQALEAAGVNYGIKEKKLAEILSAREDVESVLIAEGVEPEPGRDAELELHFEQKEKAVGTEREDGSIDFYDLGLITNVQPGDVLVTKKDPVPGKPGTNVRGEEISPPKPRDKNLPAGRNVERKDENTLVAGIAGQVVYDGKKVSVLKVYEVDGDVDLETGNIDFVGNVIVKGNVNEGFSIKAEGNVEIRGHVSAANIEADGDVIIHKGFIGKNKATIKAGGHIKTKFVENGNLHAGRSIIVSEAIMHSQLVAGERIEVINGKGLLVGGEARARKSIEANIIGSSLATTTTLEVGVDPKLKEKVNQLEEELNDLNKNLVKAEKALNILEKIKKQTGKLPKNKELMYYKFKKTISQLNNNIEEKEYEISQLKERITPVANGFIMAKRQIYSGVVLIIGNSQKRIYDGLNTSKFVEREGEIIPVTI